MTTSQALEGLKMAVEPFTEGFDWIDDEPRAPDDATVDADDYDRAITYRDIRRLRQALADLSHVPEGEGAEGGITDAMVLAGCRALHPNLFHDGLEPKPHDGPATQRMMAELALNIRKALRATALAPSSTPQDGWRPDRTALALAIDEKAWFWLDRVGPDHAAYEVTKRTLDAQVDRVLALPSANSGVG